LHSPVGGVGAALLQRVKLIMSVFIFLITAAGLSTRLDNIFLYDVLDKQLSLLENERAHYSFPFAEK